MHVCNAWLPPPVAEQTALETQAFSEAVRRLQQDCQSSSAFATLKWISVVNNFLKSKSDLATSDVELFVTIVLDLFFHTEENYYLQARWGGVLYKILKKFSKKLTLTLDWRPFYDLLLRSNFKRRHSFEGIVLKGSQVNSLSNIICKCRRFFPKDSAAEIWAEFRPMLEDLSHNVSLEAAGFISMFLPVNPQADSEFYTSEWFADCLELWDAVPYCQYWNSQWASLVGRCIRNSVCMPNLHLEQFVPVLFSHFLRSFEVPVGKTSGVYPYEREVMLAFTSDWSHSLPKDIAKSIVFLLKPSGSAQRHLDGMVDLLEQYYHPSNGGSWTYSLERFLRNMVMFFLKRLAKEQRKRSALPETHGELVYFLTRKERKTFVETAMRLIERGQFSKNASLARTAAMTSSALAYIEPSLMLSLSIARFHTALDSITATHQLEAAIKTIALSARTLVLASAVKESSSVFGSNVEWPSTSSSNELLASCKDTLELALFHTLSGLDANDPPKTIATLQLFCSIFSSLGRVGNGDEGSSSLLSVDWSQWLDDFLSRLFTLLLHLEPSNHSVEAAQNNGPNFLSKSFLVQGGSFYFSTLELLFSRLTKPLFEQAMKKVAKFVHNQTLTGAVTEIGLLCSAVIYASPKQGVVDLMRPIMCSVISSLEDCPPTGFSGIPNPQAVFDMKLTFSPALETSIVYQLNLVSLGLMYGGEHVLQCKDLLKKVIAASFDAPSAKVNEAGSHLLSSILGSVILYYPLDQYKVYQEYSGLEGIEDWVRTKLEGGFDKKDGPTWHLPNRSEIAFANELLDLHLKGALTDLKSICECGNSENSGTSAQDKEHLRVVFLRIDASLRGVRSCLPDFRDSHTSIVDGQQVQPYFISGEAGASVGSVELREEAANTLHLACNYLLDKRADDFVLLSLLCHSIAVVGNSGSLEFSEWSSAKDSCHTELKSLVEPPTNYITDHHVKGHRRPKWLIIELLLLHNTWRASQSRYNWYRAQGGDLKVPQHIILLTGDLVKLSLHSYDAVRVMAATSLKKVFKRFPPSIKESLPALLNSLQDPLAPEHAAMGSCGILASQPMSRYLTQNFGALSSFLLAILNSAHHESIKAQNAINEMFIAFIMRFGGLPTGHVLNQGESEHFESYAGLITKIQSFCSNIGNTHWRYNLMAQGMLLLLTARGPRSIHAKEDADSTLENGATGHFLLNLRSEFPPLRPLSVVALLLLLQPSLNKRKECRVDPEQGQMYVECVDSSLEASLGSILLQEGFGSVVLRNLSLDHHYADGQTRSRHGSLGSSQFSDNASFMLWVQLNLREWPRTRTWDPTMKGDAFSPRFAKLFKHLVQECGLAALEAFRGPLQEVVSELEERGLQCAAAEAIAGFLRADMECVSKAWDEWLHPLLKKLLTQASVESTAEWAACIRFAVTGKGRLGRRPPLTRSLILSCLAEPVPSTASSNAIVKHFTFLCAAVTEIFPSKDGSDEVTFEQTLLKEALKFVRHPAPQVREVVGMVICIVGANLEVHNFFNEKLGVPVMRLEEKWIEEAGDWKSFIISETVSAAAKCQREVIQPSELVVSPGYLMASTNVDSSIEKSDDIQQAVRFTETVLYFIISAMKSGRSIMLMNIIVELLQPILSLQETSHKDLSSLAKVALQFFKFQVFPTAQLPRAISALLSAANDSNWHTRIASLSFLQSFLYRHTFLLPMDGLVKIWGEVKNLLSDAQLEVRELASVTLTGMMKGADEELSNEFRVNQLENAISFLNTAKSRRRRKNVSEVSLTPTNMHAAVLALTACVLSVPYDMPRWLPKVITTVAQFAQESPPHVRATVKKTMAEFRRTHADTWMIQKSMFTEEELEILTDTSSSASYFV